MKVLHVITSLDQGGAEGILFSVILATKNIVTHKVVSLRSGGVFAERLRGIGVEVETIDMESGWSLIGAVWRVIGIIKRWRPDIVQTRLYHADLIGSIAAAVTRTPVVWAVHSNELGALRVTWRTRIVRLACSAISNTLPRAIIVDAIRTAAFHTALHYPKDRIQVIPNGVDISRFSRDDSARRRVRTQWGIAEQTRVIGLVARWHPLKDHKNLLRALALISQANGDVRCVLIGDGMTKNNSELLELLLATRTTDSVILAGPREDVAAVMNAMDLHVLSSSSESLPVAVIEAMASETPCVVTDVGDAALIVGDSGWIVPPSNPEMLSKAILAGFAMLAREGNTLKQACRLRVVNEFTVEKMATRYVNVWTIAGKK